MFVLVLIPLAAFWVGDNRDFLARVSDAPWQYVGVRERAPGNQPDGAEALPLEVDGHAFILFKQKPIADHAAMAKTPRDIEQAAER